MQARLVEHKIYYMLIIPPTPSPNMASEPVKAASKRCYRPNSESTKDFFKRTVRKIFTQIFPQQYSDQSNIDTM
jgi:hypothetical protein